MIAAKHARLVRDFVLYSVYVLAVVPSVTLVYKMSFIEAIQGILFLSISAL